MRYIKQYKIFESDLYDPELVSEIKDILADLSDKYLECQIDSYLGSPYTSGHQIKKRVPMVSVIIDKRGQTDRGFHFRGVPFKLSDIQSDIDNLISQISDRYSIHAVKISNMRSESQTHYSGFNIHIGSKTWTDPWEYVRDTTDFDVKWIKLEFEVN